MVDLEQLGFGGARVRASAGKGQYDIISDSPVSTAFGEILDNQHVHKKQLQMSVSNLAFGSPDKWFGAYQGQRSAAVDAARSLYVKEYNDALALGMSQGEAVTVAKDVTGEMLKKKLSYIDDVFNPSENVSSAHAATLTAAAAKLSK